MKGGGMVIAERIEALARAVVEERIRKMNEQQTESQANAHSFLMQVTGTTENELKESMLREPMTWIAAIIAYLEEEKNVKQ